MAGVTLVASMRALEPLGSVDYLMGRSRAFTEGFSARTSSGGPRFRTLAGGPFTVGTGDGENLVTLIPALGDPSAALATSPPKCCVLATSPPTWCVASPS